MVKQNKTKQVSGCLGPVVKEKLDYKVDQMLIS